tara:strand:- start:153 stop:521 length:369 start_codon:yes stop_codon:yes gene_type:complete
VKNLIVATAFVLSGVISFPAFANSTLFTLVTLFKFPEDSSNYVQVQNQNQNQMTQIECKTQVFLLSDNKDLSLPFGRADKWVIIGGEAELKNGELVISNLEKNNANLSFLCVPTGWSTNSNS